MLSLVFNPSQENETIVKNYLAGYDVEVQKVYDDNLNYTALSGKEVKGVLGVQRILTAKFEPMSTAQISELFQAIGLSQNGSSIKYLDPMSGSLQIRTFTCEQLPAASYFTSDDGIDFWTIPDIQFTEVIGTSSWGAA